MSYCKECGTKIDSTTKYCQNCGKKVEFEAVEDITNSAQKEPIKNTITENTLKCPKCNSTNITTQVITENKPTGCLTIIIYIFLALTIIGIPIMIIILLAKGKKTTSKTICVCQNCGKSFEKNKLGYINNNFQNLSVAKIILLIISIILVCITIADSFIN